MKVYQRKNKAETKKQKSKRLEKPPNTLHSFFNKSQEPVDVAGKFTASQCSDEDKKDETMATI